MNDMTFQKIHQNVSSMSYNANSSKVFSPILECSDEDAKNVSLKAPSYSSGVLTKSNVFFRPVELTLRLKILSHPGNLR